MVKKFLIIFVLILLSACSHSINKQTEVDINREDILNICDDYHYVVKHNDNHTLIVQKDNQRYEICLKEKNDFEIKFNNLDAINSTINDFPDLFLLNDLYRLKYHQDIPFESIIKLWEKDTYEIEFKKDNLSISIDLPDTVVFCF